MSNKLHRVWLALALLAGAFQAPTHAQVNPRFAELEPEFDSLRAMARQDRRTVVMRQMALAGEQLAAFTKIYDAYAAEVEIVNDKLVKLITDYAARFENMDDAEAARLTRDYFAMKHAQLKNREKFARQVARQLSPVKAARFVQVEGRLDVLRDLRLSQQIPLIHEAPVAAPAN
jgi:hypothetical protein